MLLKATSKKSKPLKEVFAEGRDIKGEGGDSFLRFQDWIKSQQTDLGDFTHMFSSCPVNWTEVSKLFCLRYGWSSPTQEKLLATAHSLTGCYEIADREQWSPLRTMETGMNGILWNKSVFTDKLQKKTQTHSPFLLPNKTDQP